MVSRCRIALQGILSNVKTQILLIDDQDSSLGPLGPGFLRQLIEPGVPMKMLSLAGQEKFRQYQYCGLIRPLPDTDHIPHLVNKS